MDQEIFIYIYTRFSNNLKKLDIEGMIWIDCFSILNRENEKKNILLNFL